MSHPARILVIRFSSIGDIVLTTPVLRALATQLHGGAEVHVLTKEKFAGLLEANPYVHRIHTITGSVQSVLPELLGLEFDYIIDLHNNLRSRIVRRRLKVLTFTFRKLNLQKWLWVNFGVNRMPDVHIVDRYMATLEAFGVRDDGRGLDYFIPDGAGLDPSFIPPSFADGYVAFAIGATHIGKKMDADKISALCRAIPHPVLLIGGPEDKAVAEQVMAESTGHPVLNACGLLTLHQSADAVRQARVVIAGDTGMMHIAAAFSKKIISLWGCTVPGLGMYPYRPHSDSVMIEPHGRTKRPCSKLGDRCKYGADHRCIQQLGEEEITSAVRRLW